MAEQNRNTVFAVVPESTEGTPVAPSAATQYTAVQEDLDINPSFDVLENAELRSSIGKGKPIIGIERPTASFSHYMRHSGVEGTAPDYNDLLKALFGAETANGTERTTDGGSSTSIVSLGAGGSDFSRGFAVLVKDGTNGYAIRPVHSVSSDDLTIAFNLASAPGSGIGVGKCVNYSPANSSHQTLSLWAYRANRGCIELLGGARVTEMAIEFNAGELINAKFGLAGTGYYFNPIVIAATDTYLDFLDDADTRAAVVTAKTYKDPHELASAIQSAMNGLGSANTFTCTYSNSTGKFTITSDGTTLTLKWQTGANTANTIGDKIGFSTAADDSGALTYTSDNAMTLTSTYTPTLDSADPLAAKDNEVFIGDATDSTSISASRVSVTITDERKEIQDISAVSGVSGSIVKEREATVQITALLTQYEAERFKRFRGGDNVRFCYNFGTKSGGNWVAGKCGCLYIPTAVISSFKVESDDGLVVIQMELKAYIDSSGNGEVYLNFL